MFVRFFLFLIFINPLNAIADTETMQLFKWTDNSGVVHLSEFPPEGKSTSFKVEKVHVPIAASDPPKVENNNERMAHIRKYIEDRETARELQIKTANTAKTDKKNCELAKKNLALYQTGQRIRTRVNDTNEVQILSEQDRIKRIKRSEKNMQSYCVNNE